MLHSKFISAIDSRTFQNINYHLQCLSVVCMQNQLITIAAVYTMNYHVCLALYVWSAMNGLVPHPLNVIS